MHLPWIAFIHRFRGLQQDLAPEIKGSIESQRLCLCTRNIALMYMQTLKQACRRHGIKRWPHKTTFGQSGCAGEVRNCIQMHQAAVLNREGSVNVCNNETPLNEDRIDDPDSKSKRFLYYPIFILVPSSSFALDDGSCIIVSRPALILSDIYKW